MVLFAANLTFSIHLTVLPQQAYVVCYGERAQILRDLYMKEKPTTATRRTLNRETLDTRRYRAHDAQTFASLV